MQNVSFSFSTFLWISAPNSLVVKAVNFQSSSHVLKTTGWLQSRSPLHPSKVDQMSTKNFWELCGKK